MARPLSEWVATVPTGAGTVVLAGLLVPNDGDERVDARTLTRFREGWIRTVVPVVMADGRRLQALGLVRGSENERVIELDDFGVPVEASPSLAADVARLEAGQFDEGPWAGLLENASDHLRFTLVDRVSQETSAPPAELFHLLPWYLVNELAEAVLAVLRGASPLAVCPLRHYFVAMGSLFSAALEQLHYGLVHDDPVATGEGALSLFERLGELDVSRVPDTTRSILASLVSAVSESSIFLRRTAAAALGRLLGDETMDEREGVRLAVRQLLPAAAAEAERTNVVAVDTRAITATVGVDKGGIATVAVEMSSSMLAAAIADELIRRGGTQFIEVLVESASSLQSYWLAVWPRRGRLAATLRVLAPADRFEVIVTERTGDLLKMASLPPELLLPSWSAADRAGAHAWSAALARLHSDHPLRKAFEDVR